MEAETLLEAAQALQPEILKNRRELHRHPELEFDLPYTKAFVKKALIEMGYEVRECGSGLIAMAGGKKPGKCFLLRADMDALPIQEASGVEYASQNPGKMHACGHDAHTAMLLGAAKLLNDREEELTGSVKLVFQPAEEILEGAKNLVESGVLQNPRVDAAMMIHVLAGSPLPNGTLLVMDGEQGMASCDWYEITIRGKGGHGSQPQATIDPITIGAQIHMALIQLTGRELGPGVFGVVTSGVFHAGDTPNVIPDTAVMRGTIRARSQEVEEMLKSRLVEICETTAKAFRGSASVIFSRHCPPMNSDEAAAECGVRYMRELLGEHVMAVSEMKSGGMGSGSEDFAFISQEVPAVAMMLGCGSSADGFCYPQHHPKVEFEDSFLFRGSAAYAYMAARWLEEHGDAPAIHRGDL